MSKKRSSKEEREERLDAIILMFTNKTRGKSDIYALYKEKGWELSRRQIDRDYVKAKEMFKDAFYDFHGSKRELLQSKIVDLEDMLQRARDKDDLYLQLKIEQEISKLSKLYDEDVSLYKEEVKKNDVKVKHSRSLDNLEKMIIEGDF